MGNDAISNSLDEGFDNFMADMFGYRIDGYSEFVEGKKNALWSEKCVEMMDSVPAEIKKCVKDSFEDCRKNLKNGVEIVNTGLNMKKEDAKSKFREVFNFLE